MYSASNKLAYARKYFIPKGRRNVNNKTSKRRLYDREYYRNVYLKSDHWYELRSRKLSINPVCEKCGKTKELDVHHLNYRNLYDVQLSDLQTLCRGCHIKEHKRLDRESTHNLKTNKLARKQKIQNDHDNHWNDLLKKDEIDKKNNYEFLCRQERLKIQQDMQNYHKTNESDCQSD